jgi:hypothetical protein
MRLTGPGVLWQGENVPPLHGPQNGFGDDLAMSAIEILLGVAFPLLVGIALALALGSGGATEFLIAKIAFIAAASDVFGLTTWWLYKSGFSFGNTTMGVVIGVCLVLALPAVLRWVDNKETAANEHPDVSLRFVYPKSPALVLVNNSEIIARDIKWVVVLFNMDLPDRDDPLPIPINTFDWLKPHTEGGPQNLFRSELVSPLLKPGNRLFGSASVTCPACARGRTYVVYIVWGEGGWFAELEDEKSGDIIIPRNFSKETRMKSFNELQDKVPAQSRIPIDFKSSPDGPSK